MDGERAISLIDAAESQAHALAEFVFGREAVAQLTVIDWPEVGEKVYAPTWRAVVKSQQAFLGRLIVDAVPSGKPAFIRLGSDLVRADEQNINGDDRIARAVYVIAAGLAVLLLDANWRVETAPGKPVVLTRGDAVLDPFHVVRSLADGTVSSAEWSARCAAIGISSRPLAAADSMAT